ncbi:MAG TPA: S41 family peptidase [Candidatus Acidoferrales bacterium]|nr:S41 family peptidase [Candidatus Acidoferrales bacterium]
MTRRRFLLGALLVALFALGWSAGGGRASGALYGNLDTFVEVLHAVQTSYVDPVQPRNLIEGGLHGMLRELDAWSDYLDPHEYAALKSTGDDDAGGAGLLLDLREGYPVVASTIEDSPAWNAGVRTGDVLLKVDDHATLGLSVPDVGACLGGEPGSKVTVQIARAGEAGPLDLVIERARTSTRSVPYAFVAAPGIGYARVARIGERAGAELAAALDSLRAGGAHALVLDLRGDPGGSIEQAVAVAQQLLPEGAVVATTHGRTATAARRYVAGRTRTESAWPVAVLIDGGSASAAEIVAGALQDHDRALLVGQPTFGHASVQELIPLRNDEGALRLTTAIVLTPSGRAIRRAAAADGTDDEGDDDAPADTTATPAPATVFHTTSGRVVHAGGISPDVAVDPDSLPPAARAIASRRLAPAFATRWVAQHGATTVVSDDVWSAFRAEAAQQGAAAAAEADRERAAIAPMLERELVLRSAGPEAAARVALAHDPVFQRAAAVLRQARSAREVFALATGGHPRDERPTRKAR